MQPTTDLPNDLLSLTIENAFDHIIVTDTAGKIVFANKAAEGLTGYSKQELVGRTPALWGGLMDDSYYIGLWQTIAEEKKPFVGQLKNKRKNGEIYEAEIRINPILDQQNQIKYYVGIERDITKEKEVDRMKTEILSLVAHQLKTPIGQVNAYLDNMQAGVVGQFTPSQTEYLANITQVVNRIVRMVTNILNVSRIDRGVIAMEIKPFDLTVTVQELVKVYLPACEQKGITLQFTQTEPTMVLGDQLKATEVISNVLDNAVKYTDQGGITVEIIKGEKMVSLSIKDSGLGIDPEIQKNLFSREAILRKTPSAKEGNKLGMYIVKTFLTLMHGEITVDSTVGKGSTFVISLPVA